MVNYY